MAMTSAPVESVTLMLMRDKDGYARDQRASRDALRAYLSKRLDGIDAQKANEKTQVRVQHTRMPHPVCV
jgi:hypothetical protein